MIALSFISTLHCVQTFWDCGCNKDGKKKTIPDERWLQTFVDEKDDNTRDEGRGEDQLVLIGR